MYSNESIRRRSRHFSEGGAPRVAYNEEIQPSIKLSLQGNELIYENGVWEVNGISGNKAGPKSPSSTSIDKKKLDILQKENSELKNKVDLLLDLLTTTKLDLVEALGSQ